MVGKVAAPEGEEEGEEEDVDEGGGPETRTEAAVGAADLAAAGEAEGGIGAIAAGTGGRGLSARARSPSRLWRSSPSPDGASRYAAGA
jgi:hypothetical protein